MSAGRLRLTNDKVNPPILTLCLVTDSNRKFSRNIFLDPEDGKAWAEEDLTPLERGMVFKHFTDKDSKVHVHTPYRVMDKVVGTSLSQFKSFQSESPFVSMHRNEKASRKNIRSCLQDFSLSSSDFKVFVKRNKDWIFECSSVDKEALIEKISKATSLVEDCIQRIDFIKTAEVTKNSFASLLEKVESVSEEVKVARCSRVSLTKEVSSLHNEYGRGKDRAEVDIEFNKLVRSLDRLAEENVQTLYDYVTRSANSCSDQAKPRWLKTLGEELDSLSKYYPALEHLTATGDNLELNLSGVSLVLSKGSVRIVGDITALRPYVSTDGVTISSGKRSRFSSVVMSSENDEEAAK